MISANELRIGNFVKSGKGIYKVAGIHIPNEFRCQSLDGFIIDVPCLYQPIPINEEWLLKFGFEKGANDWYGIIYNTDWSHDELNCDEIMKIDYNVKSQRLAIYDNIEESDMVNILSYPIYTANQIKYVHQLQNLYFALTQKELEYVGTN